MSLMGLFTNPERRKQSGVRIYFTSHTRWGHMNKFTPSRAGSCHNISCCDSHWVWNWTFFLLSWIRGIGCLSLNELVSDVDMRWWWEFSRSCGDSAIFISLSKSGEERPTNKRTRDLRGAWDWWRHWQPTHCRPISGSSGWFLTSNYLSISSQSAVNNADFQQQQTIPRIDQQKPK